MKGTFNITQFIQLLVLMILIAWCFFIIKPFILIIVWAIILAVALFPLYVKWCNWMGERRKKLATLFFTLIVALVLFVPTYFIVGTVVENTKLVAEQVKNDALEIPQPDDSVKDWPVIGERLFSEWNKLASNVSKYATDHRDFLLDLGKDLLTGITGFIGSLVAFVISFLIAIVFMFHSSSGHRTFKQFMAKMMGDNADEMIDISRNTIRSVVKGIILVALIQTVLAFIGFKAIGLPAAGIFAFIILVTAIIQVPATLTMIPAILIAFSISDTTPAIIFAIYSLLVGMSDNVLKPMLLGKGLKTPIVIILIGTIGGMLLHGIIGLFIGAVVLAVMHRMYLFWVNSAE
jgi:predicted PurR-regulated permease PerM